MIFVDPTVSRKAQVMRWLLMVFMVVTFFYVVLLGYEGKSLPDDFLTQALTGLGIIFGGIGIGHNFEQQIKKALRASKES